MGQAQSVPAVNKQETAKKKTSSNNDNFINKNTTNNNINKNKPTLPPAEWKNDAEFHLISPVSDISNPSLFRGRLHNYKNNNNSKSNIANKNKAPNTTTVRHRTSKVCPKQRPSKHINTTLPPPTRFYFQNHDDDDTNNSSGCVDSKKETTKKKNSNNNNNNNERNDIVDAKAVTNTTTDDQQQQKKKKKQSEEEDIVNNNKQQQQQQTHTTNKSQRTLIQTFRAKCFKAKQQLGECFIRDGSTDEDHQILQVRKYSQNGSRTSSSSAEGQQEADAYLQLNPQFQPVWKETKEVTQENTEFSPKPDSKKVSIDESTPGGEEHNIRTSNKHQQPIATVDHTSIPSRVPSPITKTGSESSFSPVRGRTLSMRSSIQRENSQSTISTVKQTQPPIFRSNTGLSNDGPRRAVIVAGPSNSFDERRTSVEEDVQRQIDEKRDSGGSGDKQPTMSRVERLRQQYMQTIETQKQQVVFAPKPSIATASSHDESENTTSTETINTKENRRSVVSNSTSYTTTTGTSNKTTGTVKQQKVARPSVDGSALLALSGWNKNKPQQQAVDSNKQQMPALLQVVGWNKPRSKSEPSQITQPPAPTATTSTTTTTEIVKAVPKKTRPKSEPTVLLPPKVPALPRREPPLTNKGRTIAFMLQQAYFNYSDEENSEGESSPLKKKSMNALVAYSPAMSVDSVNSTSSMPTVSQQATYNADFLFAAESKVLEIAPKSHQDSFSISTLDSRNRMTVKTDKPVRIPAASATIPKKTNLLEQEMKDRKVRFSDELAKKEIAIPELETKLSDLTDSTAVTGSSRSSTMSIPRIDSIPEEENYEETTPVNLSQVGENDESMHHIFEDEKEELVGETTTTNTRTTMGWSYRTEDGLTKGVTPLMSGRSTSRVTNSPFLRFKEAQQKFSGRQTTTAATAPPPPPPVRPVSATTTSTTLPVNSTFPSKSNVVTTSTRPPVTKKMSPVKRNSPVKRLSPAKCADPVKRTSGGSLVSARINAMEGRRVQSEGAVTKVVQPKNKNRRATNGHEVIAPRKSSLVSPMFKKHAPTTTSVVQPSMTTMVAPSTIQEKVKESPIVHPVQKLEPSPMLVNKLMTAPLEPPTLVSGYAAKKAMFSMDADSSSEMSEDAFGAIVHPTAIDDDDSLVLSEQETVGATKLTATANQQYYDSDTESELDQFEQLLNYQPNIDDGSFDQSPSDPSFMQRTTRTPAGDRSMVSNTSSTGDTASSIPSFLMKNNSHEENMFPNAAVGRMASKMNPHNLSFREGGTVKPNEQMHRNIPGSSGHLALQRTTTQARTWRALAAAAQEKDNGNKQRNNIGLSRRNNLSERNLNVAGHS